MKRPLGLVLGAEAESQVVLRDVLTELGIEARVASSADEALALASSEPVSLAFVDVDAVEADRKGLLAELARLCPALVAIEIASASDDGEEVPSFDRVERPLTRRTLRAAVARARSSHELKAELLRLRDGSVRGTARIGGRSEAAERFRERLARVASHDANALFVGEAGTGKELAARVVHEISARRSGPFVRVDCSSARAELFADDGPIEGARKGVVFLREIADLSFPLQDRLASVLGGDASADVRVMAGTSRDLPGALAEGRFHEDLYRHVAGQVVPVPPLRERAGDASHLAARFLEGICELNDLPVLELTPEARWRLDRYGWPGNVRELIQSMEQAALLATEGRVLDAHLPEAVRHATDRTASRYGGGSPGRKFRDAKRVVVESFEKAFLEDLMERRHGNVTAAAEEAGMLRSALQRLLRKYDLRSASYRSPGATRSSSAGN